MTLTFNGGRFSPLMLLLIKHQALLDMGGGLWDGVAVFFVDDKKMVYGSRTVLPLHCHYAI